MEYDDGTVYIGDILNGKKQGTGRLTFKNGDYFNGEFDDDEINGKGVF